ncbi:MAG: hypothetical protein FWC13_11015 [Oscillospiraceae bacterium]|nr:hypothetical protein [Oscillospiraceae bacterium]
MSIELQRKLETMDEESAYELGIQYHGERRLDEAILCWEKAADKMADAAYNLTQVLDRPGDRNKFLEWLEVLAVKHKDPWGVTLLGILLCGVEHKIWKDAGFSPLPPEEREKGLAFIKLGIEQGSDKDFQFQDYNAAAEAHYRRPGKPSFDGCTIEEVQRALEYQQKARNAIEPLARQNPMARQMADLYQSAIDNIKGYLNARR